MPKSRVQKAQQLEALNQALGRKGVVFFSHTGLKVSELEALRADLRKDNSVIVVAKRNLLRLALKEQAIQYDEASLSGAIAVAVGDDEVTPAKTLATFKKKHEQLVFQGGLLEHRFMSAVEVEQLSTLPGKQELLAKMVGSLQAPISGFVNVLAGNLRGLVNVLDAVKAQKAS
ncbi:MAG: hypothetical protein ACD_41C00142G0009 [uncultured bacterium]|nr:MAG: hypothetical protein ACD_41C00142G0009 [uncultured bacterium]